MMIYFYSEAMNVGLLLFFLLGIIEKPLIEDVQSGLKILSVSPLDPEILETSDQMTQLLLAYYWLEKGDLLTAEMLLEKLHSTPNFPFADYVSYAQAILWRQKEEPERVKPFLLPLIEKKDSIFSSRAIVLLASLLLEEQKVEEAVELLEIFRSRYASASVRVSFLDAFLTFWLEQKEWEQVFLFGNEDFFQWLPPESWRRNAFRSVVEKKWQAFRHLSAKKRQTHSRQMLSLLKSVGMNDTAIEHLQTLPASYWKWYELANLKYEEQDYDEAEKSAKQALKMARDTSQSSSVYSLLSRISARKGQKGEVLKNLDQMAKKSEFRAEAWFRKADYLSSLGDTDEARSIFQKIIQEYPSSNFAVSAHHWLFQYYLKNRKPSEAVGALEAISGQPGYQEFSLYWKAKLQENPELWKEILQEPFNYYAFQVVKETGEPVDPGTALLVNASENSDAEEPWEPVIQQLRERHLFFLALEELRLRDFFSSSHPRILFHLAWLYYLQGDYFLSIHYAERLLYSSEWKKFSKQERLQILQMAFPRSHYSILSEEASKKNIPPALILALIKQESRFDPRATSPSKARGLMQIIDSTARALASALGIPFSTSIVYDPNTNIQMGIHYFSTLLEQFNGNTILALIAYNWGPHRVKNWLSTLPEEVKSDEKMLIELVPNTQPRLYVKKILLNFWFYQSLMPLFPE